MLTLLLLITRGWLWGIGNLIGTDGAKAISGVLKMPERSLSHLNLKGMLQHGNSDVFEYGWKNYQVIVVFLLKNYSITLCHFFTEVWL